MALSLACVLDETHHFVFLPDSQPVRFVLDDAEEPIKRTLDQQEREAQRPTLALGDVDASAELTFLLAVETGEDDEVTRVVVLASRVEQSRLDYFQPIPLDNEDVSPLAGRSAGADWRSR